MIKIATETNISDLRIFARGKVRDIYDLGDKLLMISTDRISAFDYVLPNAIPYKGIVLNKLSEFWFKKTRRIVKNHYLTTSLDEYPFNADKYREILDGRSMLVKKAKRIDIECVVRGYLAGSAWKEYKSSGKVCGIKLPSNLEFASELPEPIFTPATKAESGHDINISENEMKKIIGHDLGDELKEISIRLYEFASNYARRRGIIIADTKFEFGLIDDELILIDELLTPDSSRFWPLNSYKVGKEPESMDKQFVRDYLEKIGWDKKPPVPELPPDIVEKTSLRYREIYRILTGENLK